jgi:hypothetical protein
MLEDKRKTGNRCRYLYVITEISTGHQYVGCSYDPNRRWYNHCYKPQGLLGDAIKKNGPDAFRMEIVGELKHYDGERRLVRKLKPVFNKYYVKAPEQRVGVGCELFPSKIKALKKLYPKMSIGAILKTLVAEKLGD